MLDKESPNRVRQPSKVEISAKWSLSSDQYAIFIPEAIDFIQTMHGKKVLNIQLTPYGEDLVTLNFTLSGLENILNLMYEKCYK